jgi:[ribosomal protein S5]-alanine N-acetyltransferase
VPELPPDVVLELGDVVLRRLRRDDAAALAGLRSDADIVRWSNPGGSTPDEAARAIAEAEEDWRSGRRAELAMARKTDDTLVGSISLTFYGEARASIGFEVAPEARRRGIATRAVATLCTWALTAFPALVRLELWALPGNDASMRVAERAGFHREGVFRSRLPFGDELCDVVVFSRLRTDPAPD